jgi:bacterial/archaeal transporter family-2 protein
MPLNLAIFTSLLVFAAGISVLVQQVVNANLRFDIGSPWWAGFVSYFTGTVAMLVMALALREPLPSMQMIARSHPASWLGGLFGATYIALSILLLPKLGAATTIALMVAGQMVGSLVFDHFGLLGVPVHPVSMVRLAGAALLFIGVILIRY